MSERGVEDTAPLAPRRRLDRPVAPVAPDGSAARTTAPPMYAPPAAPRADPSPEETTQVTEPVRTPSRGTPPRDPE